MVLAVLLLVMPLPFWFVSFVVGPEEGGRLMILARAIPAAMAAFWIVGGLMRRKPRFSGDERDHAADQPEGAR